MDRERLDQSLGPDLATLVASHPARLVGARMITGLRAKLLDRQTFRLRFAGGLVLKGRRLDREEDARRIDELTRRLDGRWFTPPIARHGAALLEPWVNGVTLDRHGPTPTLLRECGQALGSVHAVQEDLEGHVQGWQPDGRLANVVLRLERLATQGALSARMSRRLAGIARAELPGSAATGIVHRDLMPRNVIIDASGAPRVVDNGSINLGAHDFDLARTAYLWPMAGEHEDEFRAGYADSAGRSPVPSRFWMIDVLADVALFRLLSGARGVSRPIRLLREMAAPA